MNSKREQQGGVILNRIHMLNLGKLHLNGFSNETGHTEIGPLCNLLHDLGDDLDPPHLTQHQTVAVELILKLRCVR